MRMPGLPRTRRLTGWGRTDPAADPARPAAGDEQIDGAAQAAEAQAAEAQAAGARTAERQAGEIARLDAQLVRGRYVGWIGDWPASADTLERLLGDVDRAALWPTLVQHPAVPPDVLEAMAAHVAEAYHWGEPWARGGMRNAAAVARLEPVAATLVRDGLLRSDLVEPLARHPALSPRGMRALTRHPIPASWAGLLLLERPDVDPIAARRALRPRLGRATGPAYGATTRVIGAQSVVPLSALSYLAAALAREAAAGYPHGGARTGAYARQVLETTLVGRGMAEGRPDLVARHLAEALEQDPLRTLDLLLQAPAAGRPALERATRLRLDTHPVRAVRVRALALLGAPATPDHEPARHRPTRPGS